MIHVLSHAVLSNTGWTVRGLNPGGGEIFSTRSDRSWDPPSLLHIGYRVSFPGLKLSGRVVNHPHSYCAEVKERVELYLYSPSGPSWPVLVQTLLLHYSIFHPVNDILYIIVLSPTSSKSFLSSPKALHVKYCKHSQFLPQSKVNFLNI